VVLGEMLACWPHLHELRMRQTFISANNLADSFANALAPLSQLTLLAMPGIEVTRKVSSVLEMLQELCELDLSAGSGDLAVLAHLRQLAKVSVSGSGFSRGDEENATAVACALTAPQVGNPGESRLVLLSEGQ
jgi:hypothetical protein